MAEALAARYHWDISSGSAGHQNEPRAKRRDILKGSSIVFRHIGYQILSALSRRTRRDENQRGSLCTQMRDVDVTASVFIHGILIVIPVIRFRVSRPLPAAPEGLCPPRPGAVPLFGRIHSVEPHSVTSVADAGHFEVKLEDGVVGVVVVGVFVAFWTQVAKPSLFDRHDLHRVSNKCLCRQRRLAQSLIWPAAVPGGNKPELTPI